MNVTINTVEELCNQIGVSFNFLKYVLYVKKDNYVTFTIPKKNGGSRCITAPTRDLKSIQRKLLYFLEKNYTFLHCQHGFIKGRSCVTNAKNHVGKRFVLNGDIENFFDNIHFGRVRGLFLNKPFFYSNEVATTIAKIVCFNRKLPQGAPTSPIISNMVCYVMDKQLDYIARKNNCKYTRYADDITFSTDSEYFPNAIAEIKGNDAYFSERVVKILNGGFNNGFVFNKNKTKFFRRMYRQEVTGLIVNKKVNVNAKYVKKLRAMLYNIRKNGMADTYAKTFAKNEPNEDIARKRLYRYLCGKISYLKMVKGDMDLLYLKYAKEFNEIFNVSIFDVTLPEKMHRFLSDKCYVIETNSYGTAFSVSDGTLYTSTHVILDKSNFPNIIYDDKKPGYVEQFPFKSGNIESGFVYIKHPNDAPKIIDNFEITKSDYENDIISLSARIPKERKLTLSNEKIRVGDTVYMAGYPAFNGFDKTNLHLISTKVIGENTFLSRKLINTIDSPKHGMSGGPVLNSKFEVVGIVYAGYDYQSDENVGFISLV